MTAFLVAFISLLTVQTPQGRQAQPAASSELSAEERSKIVSALSRDGLTGFSGRVSFDLELSLPGDPGKGPISERQEIHQRWTITTDDSGSISGRIQWRSGENMGKEVQFGENPDSIWWADAGELGIFSKAMLAQGPGTGHEVEINVISQLLTQSCQELKNILSGSKSICEPVREIRDVQRRPVGIAATVAFGDSEVEVEFHEYEGDYIVTSCSRTAPSGKVTWRYEDYRRVNETLVPGRLAQQVKGGDRSDSQFVYSNIEMRSEDRAQVKTRLSAPQNEPSVRSKVHVVVIYDQAGVTASSLTPR